MVGDVLFLKGEAGLCSQAHPCWEAGVGAQAWGLSLGPAPGRGQGLGAGSRVPCGSAASSLEEEIRLLWGIEAFSP